MLHLPTRSTRTNRDIQFGFADIDADPTCLLSHLLTDTPVFSTAARPCGYGLTRWWPWQRFGLCSSRTGRPRSLAATADQSRIGLSRPLSAFLKRRTPFRDTKQTCLKRGIHSEWARSEKSVRRAGKARR